MNFDWIITEKQFLFQFGFSKLIVIIYVLQTTVDMKPYIRECFNKFHFFHSNCLIIKFFLEIAVVLSVTRWPLCLLRMRCRVSLAPWEWRQSRLGPVRYDVLLNLLHNNICTSDVISIKYITVCRKCHLRLT